MCVSSDLFTSNTSVYYLSMNQTIHYLEMSFTHTVRCVDNPSLDIDRQAGRAVSVRSERDQGYRGGAKAKGGGGVYTLL